MNEVTAIELYEKARRLHERGKLSRAEQFYRKAIKTNKRFAPAHNNLGNMLVDRNRLAEATRAYQDALAHAPGDPRVLNNLGNVLHLRGKSKEAVSLLYTALETDPDYLDALNNLGNALSSLGRFNEATAVYHKAIQLAPNFAQLHLNLGRTLMDSGKLEFAIDSFTQAITLDPNYAQAYYSRGNAFQDLGQFTDASESYQQALQINPSASIVHLALSGLKKYEDTDPHIAVMQNLLGTYRQDDPNRAMLCFALAKAYDDLREFDRSFHYLSEGNRLRSKQLDYDLFSPSFRIRRNTTSTRSCVVSQNLIELSVFVSAGKTMKTISGYSVVGVSRTTTQSDHIREGSGSILLSPKECLSFWHSSRHSRTA